MRTRSSRASSSVASCRTGRAISRRWSRCFMTEDRGLGWMARYSEARFLWLAAGLLLVMCGVKLSHGRLFGHLTGDPEIPVGALERELLRCAELGSDAVP